MSVEDREPLLNTRFRVEIEGLPAAGVVEVILPEARIVDGGAARTVQYGLLTLRRALTAPSDWYAWWEVSRSARAPLRKRIAVVLMDRQQADQAHWAFVGALPSAYSVSALNAARAEVLIETLELSVAGMTVGFGGPAAAPRPAKRPTRGASRTRARR